MTYARREEIFSKDYITTRELQEILGFKSLSQASLKMFEIKHAVGDRLGVKGKVHTEDYFEFFGVHPTDRYNRLTQDRELSENETQKHSYEETQQKNYEYYRKITGQDR